MLQRVTNNLGYKRLRCLRGEFMRFFWLRTQLYLNHYCQWILLFDGISSQGTVFGIMVISFKLLSYMCIFQVTSKVLGFNMFFNHSLVFVVSPLPYSPSSPYPFNLNILVSPLLLHNAIFYFPFLRRFSPPTWSFTRYITSVEQIIYIA